MNAFKCDQCQEVKVGLPPVRLVGINKKTGGILLPAQYHNNDFCSPECFWHFADEQRPDQFITQAPKEPASSILITDPNG